MWFNQSTWKDNSDEFSLVCHGDEKGHTAPCSPVISSQDTKMYSYGNEHWLHTKKKIKSSRSIGKKSEWDEAEELLWGANLPHNDLSCSFQGHQRDWLVTRYLLAGRWLIWEKKPRKQRFGDRCWNLCCDQGKSLFTGEANKICNLILSLLWCWHFLEAESTLQEF